jgi:hypothetical protein
MCTTTTTHRFCESLVAQLVSSWRHVTPPPPAAAAPLAAAVALLEERLVTSSSVLLLARGVAVPLTGLATWPAAAAGVASTEALPLVLAGCWRCDASSTGLLPPLSCSPEALLIAAAVAIRCRQPREPGRRCKLNP